MGITTKKRESWPPKGWPQFSGITQKSAQALVKDLKTARIYGLSYCVRSTPLYQLDGRYYCHTVDIAGWEYTIQNDSQEYPVLSFKLTDRYDQAQPMLDYISSVKVFARPIDVTAQNAKRAALAGLFLMKQVGEGFVPDPRRVLKVYRLLNAAPDIFKNIDPEEFKTVSYKDV